jgi:hypothetical protein
MRHRWINMWGCVFVLALALTWGLYAHQAGGPSQVGGSASHDRPRGPIKTSMEELHQHGGVPPGWQFHFPDGDAVAGRGLFAKLECYQCHAIQGESFPQTSSQAGNTGPELTGMGDHHPTEYFAESILNPHAVIVTGPGYTDAAGMSIMPDYRDSLSVAELIDLVAYLKALKGGQAHAAVSQHDGHGDQGALLEQVVGEYRIRITYHEAKAAGHGPSAHGHGAHGGGKTQATGQHHLMAFITDVKTGEPVPYLPVTASIATAKQAPRQVKLTPMLGGQGFHYGAEVTLPPQPAKVMLSIGATTMRLMPSAAGRFASPQKVSFEWTPRQTGSTGAAGHSPQHRERDKHGGGKGH